MESYGRTMARFYSIVMFFVVVLFSGCSHTTTVPLDKNRVDHVLHFGEQQLLKTVVECADSSGYPRATNSKGMWNFAPSRDWTSGFFPGCLWKMYELNGSGSMKESALRWTDGLSEQQFLTTTHDIGFIMFCSFGNAYRLTHNETYRPVLLQAARSLMTRYNPVVGCLRSWDNRKWVYPVIIDNMMNLELLFWASKNGGTKAMYDAAVSHAEHTMNNHFRPDGSTWHVLDYDTTNGSVTSRVTHQGYADGSVWARGQAWAIYGFTMAYRETGDMRFLETARRAADWFINHLPDDGVPFWDFNAPDIPREPRDASAAAIASSALFEFSGCLAQPDAAAKYRSTAIRILSALCTKEYLAEGTTSRGIITHATGNKPRNVEVDVSLIYGDYYFLEALTRFRSLPKEVRSR